MTCTCHATPAEHRADERRRQAYCAILEHVSRLAASGNWPCEEMWVPFTHVWFDPYELPGWRFGIRLTHTARTDEALRSRWEADGRVFVRFAVKPLTEVPE